MRLVAEGRRILHAGAKAGRSFEQERADQSANVFDAVVKHIADIRADGRKVVIAGWTAGSLDRLAQILAEHHLEQLTPVETLADAEKLKPGQAGLAVLPIEAGFDAGRFVVVAEQDILGDRLVRRSKKRRRASDFIAEAGFAGGRRHRRPQRSRHRPLHRPEDHRGGRRAA